MSVNGLIPRWLFKFSGKITLRALNISRFNLKIWVNTPLSINSSNC